MNRRGFLSLLGGVLAAGALNEVIPLGRVWSFPSKIVVPWRGYEIELAENTLLTTQWVTQECLRVLQKHMKFTEYYDRRIIDSFKEAA